ncbi:MAG: NACHT domain-containing protein [Acidobacteriota bacterium]
MRDVRPTGTMLRARGIYDQVLRKYFSTVDLAGLAPDDEPLALRKIYVPLVLTDQRLDDNTPEDQLGQHKRTVGNWLDYLRSGLYDSVPTVASTKPRPASRPRQLLISGEAGSGKTTLVRSIVSSLIGVETNELGAKFRNVLPVPLTLREAPLDRLDSLEDLVRWWFEEVQREDPRLEVGPLRSYLDKGWALLLLDGLDEVGSVDKRRRVLEWLERSPWIRHQRNLAVVTARPSGFERLPEHSAQIRVHVAPFSTAQIREYLDRWFRLRPMTSRRRDEVVDELVERLTAASESTRLRPMARRPAYLAALAFVHGTRGDLPHSRAALYELLVDAYIDMLDKKRGLDKQRRDEGLPVWDRNEKIEILSAVASLAHIGATSEKRKRTTKSNDRRFLFSLDELETAVERAIDHYDEERLRTVQRAHAKELTKYFVARTGLLIAKREGHYQFGHLSLQEYLTAVFLLAEATSTTNKSEALEESLFSRLDQPGWQEVAILALAIDSDRTGGTGHQATLKHLDLTQPAHVDFLGRLLGGEELRLARAERHDLVVAWVAGAAISKTWSSWDDVTTQARNADGLIAAWRATCRWMAQGERENYPRALRPALRRDTTTHEAANDPLATLSGAKRQSSTHRSTSPGATLLRQVHDPSRPIEAHPDPLLIVPLTLQQWTDEDIELVVRVIASQEPRWELDEKHVPVVPPRWYWLEPWPLLDQRVAGPALEVTPLLWTVLWDRVGAVQSLRQVEEQQPLRWSEVAWLRINKVDRWAALFGGSRALALARARARDLDLARDLARDLDLARARDLDLARARDLDLDLAVHTLKYIDAFLSQTALDAPQQHHQVAKAQKRLSSIRFGRLGDRSHRLVTEALEAIAAASLALTLEPFLEASDSTPSLAFLREELTALQDPDTIVADLDDPETRARRRKEWQQILDSPFSPIPVLEAVIEEMEAQGLEHLDASADALLAQIDDAISTLEQIASD